MKYIMHFDGDGWFCTKQRKKRKETLMYIWLKTACYRPDLQLCMDSSYDIWQFFAQCIRTGKWEDPPTLG